MSFQPSNDYRERIYSTYVGMFQKYVDTSQGWLGG